MTFADHLAAHRNDDGSYDLAAAGEARKAEIMAHPGEIESLADAKVERERRRWESQETDNLKKQFAQPALSPELELDVKVPLGNSLAMDLGDMNEERIRIRRDLRLKIHKDEERSFLAEDDFWSSTQQVLKPQETIRDAVVRMSGDAA